MFYPEDFIKKVKEEYPNDTELHRRLDEGDVFVGRILDDSSPQNISIDSVLKATTLSELQDMARSMKKRVELYKEWYMLYSRQFH